MNLPRRVAVTLALLAALAVNVHAAAPAITSFTPGSGKLTAPVTITGTNFAAPATVKFNGVASTSVTVSSATTIKATVPNTTASGKLSVTTSGGTATSTGTFTVLPGIVALGATGLPAPLGQPFAARTLAFSGFAASEAVDLYFDRDGLALATTDGAGAGSAPVTIPGTAASGIHWITAVGRRSGFAAQSSFTVRTDSLQYGFRPTHRGNNSFENTLGAGNVSRLEEAWRTPSYGSTNAVPAVVAGVVYAHVGDGTVRAFNESTGVQKWSASVGGTAAYSSPAVSGGVVYVGSEDNSLYALDASTGALKWRFQIGDAVYSSPTVVNGVVYFGSYDDSVYALNASTGAFIWSFATGGVVFSSPAVVNGVVYVGSDDGYLYALKASNGAMVWKYNGGGEIVSSPVMVNGLVYFGSRNNGIYAVHASTGLGAWSYGAEDTIEGSPAVANGIVYCGGTDGKVYSFRASDGSMGWTFTDPFHRTFSTTPFVANGVLYIADSLVTFALNASNGGVLAAFPVNCDYASPVVVNGALTSGNASTGAIVHYTLDAVHTNAAVPRPEPSSLRPRGAH